MVGQRNITKAAMKNASAVYMCVVILDKGVKISSNPKRIIVVCEPNKPDNVTIINNDATGTSINWKAPFDGNSNITAYVVEITDHLTNNTNLFMTSLTQINVTRLVFNRNYSVRVFARNAIGNSSQSVSVSFQTTNHFHSAQFLKSIRAPIIQTPQEVVEKQTVRLFCRHTEIIDFNVDLSYTWIVNGKTVISRSKTLRKFEKVVYRNDTGDYVCQLFYKNEKKRISSDVYSMKVLFPPSPVQLTIRNDTVRLPIGQSFYIMCSTADVGLPRGSITWSSTTRHRRVVLNVTSLVTESQSYATLNILDVQRKHNGSYECVARNRIGLRNAYVNLLILEKPDAPNNVKIRLTSASSITVSWIKPYNGNSPISAYDVRLADQFGNSVTNRTVLDSISVHFTNLVFNRIYEVTVRARNAQGTGNWSSGQRILMNYTTNIVCPSGTIRYKSDCYYRVTSQITWASAHEACKAKSLGAKVVNISTNDELSFISNTFQPNGTWIEPPGKNFQSVNTYSLNLSCYIIRIVNSNVELSWVSCQERHATLCILPIRRYSVPVIIGMKNEYRRNDNVNITCYVPPLSIGLISKYTWTKEGVILRNTKTFYESSALSSDTGTYACVVTYSNSTIQVASKPLRMTVTSLPDPPSNLRIVRRPTTLVRSRSTTLITWQIPFDGHLKIDLYYVKIFDQLTKSLSIREAYVNSLNVPLHLNVNYTISVSARNRIGTSNYSKELSFTSKSTHVTIPRVEGTTLVYTNHSISLKCISNQLSDGNSLHFDWFRNDKVIETGETFFRKAANRKDTGKYLCRVTIANHTRIVSKAVSLLVVYAPGAPRNLQFVPTENSRGLLSWTHPADFGNSRIILYDIYLTNVVTGLQRNFNTTNVSFDIQIPVINREYRVKVRSQNVYSFGIFTKPMVIKLNGTILNPVPPSSRLIQVPNIIGNNIVRARHRFVLTCLVSNVHDNKRLDFTWLYNGKALLTESRSLSMTLTRNESGSFICQTTYKDLNITTGSDSFAIVVYDLPDAPIDLNIEKMNSTMLNLKWKLLFSGNTMVTQYQGYLTEHGTQRNLTFYTGNMTMIENYRLIANRHYTVQVRAKNIVGFSNYSNPLSFVMDNVTGYEVYVRGALLVAKNKPFNLTCHTSNGSFSNITWFKDGRVASVSGKYYAGIAQLHNAGTYVCQATFFNYVTVASGARTLQIAVLPGSPTSVTTVLSQRRSYFVEILISWEIPFSGISPITWYQVNLTDDVTTKEISRTSHLNSLYITRFVFNRNYTVQVRARNFAGYGNFSVPKFIYFASSPPIISGKRFVLVAKQLNLYCNVTNLQYPVYRYHQIIWRFLWLVNGKEVSNGQTMNKTADIKDTGVYICETFMDTNSRSISFSSYPINIYVQNKPATPGDVHVVLTTGNSIKIRWTEPFTGHSPIIRYNIHLSDTFSGTIQTFATSSNKTDYVITSLILNRIYVVKVRALNSVGIGNFSTPVDIIANNSDLIPKIDTQTIQRLKTPSTLRCLHNSNVLREVWFKDKRVIKRNSKWQRNDGGNYFCQVTYQNGTVAVSNIKPIVVVWEPDAPTRLTRQASKGAAITFTWRIPFNGNSPLTYYEVEITEEVTQSSQMLNSTNNTIKINEFILNRVYACKVRAKNRDVVEFGEYSSSMTFDTDNKADMSMCAPGWKLYNQHCYNVFQNNTHGMNWYEALTSCKEQHGANLLSVSSTDEVRFVRRIIPYDARTWIGLLRTTIGRESWSDNSSVSKELFNQSSFIPLIAPVNINSTTATTNNKNSSSCGTWNFSHQRFIYIACQIQLPGRICKKRATKVTVTTPTTLGKSIAVEHTVIEFACDASHDRFVATYSWWKNGAVIANTSSFTLNVTRADEGKYYCEVEYTNGVVISSAPRNLLVQYGVAQVTIDTKEIVNIVAGKRLTRICTTENLGVPAGNLIWKSFSTPSSGLRTNTSNVLFKSNFGEKELRLFIRNVRRSDNGVYTCRLNNTVATSEKSFKLVVLEVPYPPHSLNLSAVNTTTKFLKWSQPYDGNSAILKYEVLINEKRYYSNIAGIYISVSPNTAYRIILRGLNTLGDGAWSKEFKHRTPVAAPPPYQVELPKALSENVTIDSFVVEVVKFSERNGNIGRYEIVAMELNSTQRPVNDPQTYTPQDIKYGRHGLLLVASRLGLQEKYFNVTCLVDKVISPTISSHTSIRNACVRRPTQSTYYSVFVRAYVTDALYQTTAWYPVIKTAPKILLPYVGRLETPKAITEDSFTIQLVQFNEKYTKARYYMVFVIELSSSTQSLPVTHPNNFTDVDMNDVMFAGRIDNRLQFGKDFIINCFPDSLDISGLLEPSCTNTVKANTSYATFVRGYIDTLNYETSDWYPIATTSPRRKGQWLYWEVIADCIALDNGQFLRLYKHHCNLPGKCEGIDKKNETCIQSPLNPVFNRTVNKVMFKIQLENISIAGFGGGRYLMAMLSTNRSLYNDTLQMSSAFLTTLVDNTTMNIRTLEVTSIKRASGNTQGRATMDYFVTMIMNKTENLTKSEIGFKLGFLKRSLQSRFIVQNGYKAQISSENITLSDYNNCLDNPCAVHAHCINNEERLSYFCQCMEGYKGDGFYCSKVGSWTKWKTVAECIPLNGEHVKLHQRTCVNGSFCDGANQNKTNCVPRSSQRVKISPQSQFKGVITLAKNTMLANATGPTLRRLIQKKGEVYRDIVNVSKQRLKDLYQERNINVTEINIDIRSIVSAGEFVVLLDYSVVTVTSSEQDTLINTKPVVASTDIFAGIAGYRSFTEPALIVASDVDECRQNIDKCHAHAHCIKFQNKVSYSCQCKQGYTGDGFKCQEETFPTQWSQWSQSGPCLPATARRSFNRDCKIQSSGQVVAVQKCAGANSKNEPCDPKPVFTNSDESIAKGKLVIKQLMYNGVNLTNNDLSHIIAEKGKVYHDLKSSTEKSLFRFYREKNPNVIKINVTKLSVGSLVTEYIIVLKGNNNRLSDLNGTFPEEDVRFFNEDSSFSATTSAKYSQVSDYNECIEKKNVCGANAYCLVVELSHACQCKDTYILKDTDQCIKVTPAGKNEDGQSDVVISSVSVCVVLFVVIIIFMVTYIVKKKTRQRTIKQKKQLANAELGHNGIGDEIGEKYGSPEVPPDITEGEDMTYFIEEEEDQKNVYIKADDVLAADDDTNSYNQEVESIPDDIDSITQNYEGGNDEMNPYSYIKGLNKDY